MKFRSHLYSSCFFFFLFANDIAVHAQHVHDNAEKIKDILTQCDSVKNNFMLAAKDGGALLRDLAFEGLHSVPADDAEDRAQFFYYAAFGYVFHEPTNADTVSYYFIKSLDEAKKSKSTALIANAAISMMHIGFELQDNKQTQTYKNIIQSIVDTTKNEAVLQNGYAALGTYYQQKSYYNTAQDFFLKSITLQQKQPAEN